MSSFDMAETKLAKYNNDITQLSDTLMTLEMQTVDQLEVRPGRYRHVSGTEHKVYLLLPGTA